MSRLAQKPRDWRRATEWNQSVPKLGFGGLGVGFRVDYVRRLYLLDYDARWAVRRKDDGPE